MVDGQKPEVLVSCSEMQQTGAVQTMCIKLVSACATFERFEFPRGAMPSTGGLRRAHELSHFICFVNCQSAMNVSVVFACLSTKCL